MSPDLSIEDVARRALSGDRKALEGLVESLRGDMYGLALRMLWNRHDAEDATQEILIRLVTRLSSFDFRSRLRTWAYRVAMNYLLDVKKSAVEQMNMNFVRLSEDLIDGLATDAAEAEASVLIEEVKIGCTLAMLQCLDRPHRAAYIVGDILDLSGSEAAEALNIDASLFRKRLERARAAVTDFVRSHCGLVSDTAACRCPRRVAAAVRLGRVRTDALQYAERSVSFRDVRAIVQNASDARRTLELHRSNQLRQPSSDLTRKVLSAIEGHVGTSGGFIA